MASTSSQPRGWNNSCVECHDGRDSGRPFHWTHSSVNSVAFSPDGQHIVSGSNDRTIRVWNAMTGETAAGPFTGHTAWSTLWHSRQMASTSSQVQMDRTIRVWNAMTGETVAGPFTGHTDSSVCGILARWPAHRLRFRRSNNSCVECHDGRDSGRPFHWTHRNKVRSVAFSPDGQHIVSGSNDRTIRVWNAMTGETAAGPFTGHTDSVGLWHSRQMASTSSQVQTMEQFVCGMP
jgi:WD40 repeat protein